MTELQMRPMIMWITMVMDVTGMQSGSKLLHRCSRGRDNLAIFSATAAMAPTITQLGESESARNCEN